MNRVKIVVQGTCTDIPKGFHLEPASLLAFTIRDKQVLVCSSKVLASKVEEFLAMSNSWINHFPSFCTTREHFEQLRFHFVDSGLEVVTITIH